MSLSVIFSVSVGSEEFVCQLIDYFPRENYSPDSADSTMAIPSKLRRLHT